ATYFHDITRVSRGKTVDVGYDYYTGLGSPVAKQVVAGLVGWSGSGSAGTLATGAAAPAGKAGAHLGLPEAGDTRGGQEILSSGFNPSAMRFLVVSEQAAVAR